MKVIIKSYYKNSNIFKKGEYVKPIPSSSSFEELKSFLKEKINHESLNGNYSKSELEFIETHLVETEEYKNAKKFKWNNFSYIILFILSIIIIYKVFSLFFGWIIFLSVIALIVYPIYKGGRFPKINGIIASTLIAFWFIWGGDSIDTNRCLEISDIAGSYESKDNQGNKERRASIARAFGYTVGDVELILNKNGTYTFKEWSTYNGELKQEVNGTWKVECEEDKDYIKGQVKSIDYTNTVKLSKLDDMFNNYVLSKSYSNTLDNSFTDALEKR